jgi:RNA polymerase sigma-70 factor (ECF subfamily)
VTHANVTHFNELYRDNRLSILNYFLRRTNDREQAADCLAQTFLIAWRRIDDIPAGIEDRLWLYGVARRINSETKRSKFREERLLQRVVSAMSPRPETTNTSDSEAQLHEALAKLSHEDREIVLLNVWDQLNPIDIAAVLDMNVNTVKTRLHRSRSKLKAALLSRLATDA